MCILRLRNHLCRTALVYVSNKRRFPGRHHNSIHRLLISFVQTVSTSRVSIVFSRYFQELVPHLFTEQSLGPNVSVISKKKEKEKRGLCFPGLIVYFVLFFSRKQKTFSRQARAPVTGGEGGVGTPYIHTYIHTYTSSRIYENHTSWLLEATHLKTTQLKSIIPRNSALTHGFLTASPLSLFSPQ